ncbi:MAG: GNAT family N-acetyltransferase, partial [Fimbriimonadaceae bacterium]
ADIAGVVALQRDCFPPPFPEDLLWQAEHIAHHLEIFPEGQWVAEQGGRIVASCTNLILDEAIWQAHLDWESTVGGHFLRAHTPGGTTLYGVDLSVAPASRGQGIGRQLYQARFELVRSLGLARYGTAVRMPDYLAQAAGRTPHDYAHAVVQGILTDRTLTPLLRMGTQWKGVIENHMDDEESGHAAAILEWRP